MNLSDFLNSINHKKNNLFQENEEFAEKSYLPYIVNRCLSYFPDTILHANLMNMNSGLPKRMQYEYYLNSIRKNKRFSKTHKNEMTDEMSVVVKHFSISRSKAREIIPLLKTEFLDELKDIYLKNH